MKLASYRGQEAIISHYQLILSDNFLADYQLDLFESKQIRLEIPMRKNQRNYKKQTYIFRKKRKRIETLFSQLCDQFMIRRNYAKTFEGFKTRILSKITAVTIIQYISKQPPLKTEALDFRLDPKGHNTHFES